ncbi:unnamed protein product [Ceratitis capitata]|uniref:(Mediterranean fruit fly) hypothetical protein n=1 Tax=Ceratitis capitata TaxID=7213 RepID=W8AVQ3_CERCA|nr:unnamed protein product [Ceratitis capitata]
MKFATLLALLFLALVANVTCYDLNLIPSVVSPNTRPSEFGPPLFVAAEEELLLQPKEAEPPAPIAQPEDVSKPQSVFDNSNIQYTKGVITGGGGMPKPRYPLRRI